MTMGFQVTIDAADPGRQAEFWAVALGYVVEPPPPEFDSWEQFAESINLPAERRNDLAAVVHPDRSSPRLLFQRYPRGRP